MDKDAVCARERLGPGRGGEESDGSPGRLYAPGTRGGSHVLSTESTRATGGWLGSTARQRALSDLGDNGVVIHVSTSRVANIVISCIIELCRKGTLLGREWGGGVGEHANCRGGPWCVARAEGQCARVCARGPEPPSKGQGQVVAARWTYHSKPSARVLGRGVCAAPRVVLRARLLVGARRMLVEGCSPARIELASRRDPERCTVVRTKGRTGVNHTWALCCRRHQHRHRNRRGSGGRW